MSIAGLVGDWLHWSVGFCGESFDGRLKIGGADLNAYAKVENQAGCCSPSMSEAKPNGTNALQVIEGACCAPAPSPSPSLHDNLTMLLSQHDINAAAASVKVYAIKPQIAASKVCCVSACCS